MSGVLLHGKVLTISRNNTLAATLTYSAQTARLNSVTYAGGMATSFGYGPTGSVDSKSYTTTHGTYTETVTRSQSGRILADVFTDPTGLADPTEYSYDEFGRLVTADLSDQTFAYGFDPVAGCGVQNAGLNGNRTTQSRTVGGVSTTDTYCYTAGDRLTSASQVNGAITYDLHGNITTLGDVSFTYDSLDRHVSTVLPNGSVITLERDIDGSVLTRTVTGPNPEVVKYSSGVVEFFLDGNKYVTGTALSLPGGVTVTTVGTAATSTFTSLQGHACLTSTAASTTRTRFDPFGTPLTALPDTVPGTAEPGFGTVAGKLTDTITPYGIIDMGARLYSTVLGRFLQVDPVPGGGVNAYAYPPDPVNMNDYSGMVYSADALDGWSGGAKNWDGKGNARASTRGMASTVARRNNISNTRKLVAVLGSVSAIVGLFGMIPGGGWVSTIASIAISGIAVGVACNGTLSQQECAEESTEFGVGLLLGRGVTHWAKKNINDRYTRRGIEAVSDFSQSVYGVLNSATGYRNAQWNP